MIKKIKSFIFGHKIISAIILLAVVLGGFFLIKALNKGGGEISYVLAKTEKGTIVSSVSGSGQVVAYNEVNIKPKASGDITYVGVKNSQQVFAGKLIAAIDPTDAKKAVEEAELNLEEGQYNLEKMRGAQTDLGYIRGVKEKAEDNLSQAYENGFNTVSNAFLDLPSIVVGLKDILFGYDLIKTSQNIDYYRDSYRNFSGDGSNLKDARATQYYQDTYDSYKKAKSAYDKNSDDYKIVSRFSEGKVIESLIAQTYDTTKEIGEAVRNTMNLVQLYQDAISDRGITPNSVSNTHLASLNSYTGKINSYVSSLFAIKNTIESNKESLAETTYTISDQEMQIKKLQQALDNAKEDLKNCYVYAPFTGIVTQVNVKMNDSVSSGTTIATIVTKENTAKVSLNEVDAAKVKVGQKATTTFDAIEGLTITGEVSEIDSVGTASQGVVLYNAIISFDTQDDRVKPGMSASSSIITDSKTDVLIIPNTAIKSSGGKYYVQISINPKIAPVQQEVEIGINDDSNTEIISGLKEGDQVVSKTINPNSQSKKTTSNNRGVQGFFMSGGGPSR